MKTIKTEYGKIIGISDESYAAIVDAAREPVGEALMRDLEPGRYKICGKRLEVSFDCVGNKDFRPIASDIDYSYIDVNDDVWEDKEEFEAYIGMKAADLRQHHIKPYTVEWRDMTREEVLAFVAHYDGKIVVACDGGVSAPSLHYTYHMHSTHYSFAHIERDGTIGEAHKFRCTVDAPHKVEGTGYEF